MLIIPAATAYLLTDRMHRLVAYAAVLGVLGLETEPVDPRL